MKCKCLSISEKWDRISTNYTSENWKRNNKHLRMLSFGRNCKTGISFLKSYQMMQVLWHWYYCRHWCSQRRKFYSKRQKRGFSVDTNVQPIAVISFETTFFFVYSAQIISFQNANCRWSGTCFSFTLAWNKTCQNVVLWWNHKDVLITVFLDGGLKA